MDNLRTEKWRGHDIRFIKLDNGEWWASLEDVCDALELLSFKVASKLRPFRFEMVCPRQTERGMLDCMFIEDKRGEERLMFTINERGIYEVLLASGQFDDSIVCKVSSEQMQKFREVLGFAQYEVMYMTDPEIQKMIKCTLSLVDDCHNLITAIADVVGENFSRIKEK